MNSAIFGACLTVKKNHFWPTVVSSGTCSNWRRRYSKKKKWASWSWHFSNRPLESENILLTSRRSCSLAFAAECTDSNLARFPSASRWKILRGKCPLNFREIWLRTIFILSWDVVGAIRSLHLSRTHDAFFCPCWRSIELAHFPLSFAVLSRIFSQLPGMCANFLNRVTLTIYAANRTCFCCCAISPPVDSVTIAIWRSATSVPYPFFAHLATLAQLKTDLLYAAHERSTKRQKVDGETAPITSFVDPIPRDIVPQDMQMLWDQTWNRKKQTSRGLPSAKRRATTPPKSCQSIVGYCLPQKLLPRL